MTRLTTLFTAAGLSGLILTMLTALNPEAPAALLAFGFSLMLIGLLGALFGAAASVTRAWQSTR
ncbi:MAG: hypothetical protein AB3N19_15380 [Ruegeria sp.]